MPIFTFEKHKSSKSLADKLAMVDTSYMIVLSDEDDQRNEVVAPFHFNAIENGATFAINTVVRQEFIKDVRKKVLIDSILSLAQADQGLDARYRSVLSQTKGLSVENLKHKYELIYKDHVKKGDDHILRSLIEATDKDIWEKVATFEAEVNLVYTRPKTGTNGDDLWQNLGDLMRVVCMGATDAMIANLALNIGADAIVTTDCDFIPLAPIIDVYVPKAIAEQCHQYDEREDDAAAIP